MGMDVSGKNPTKDIGIYFLNNLWWWRPLADYCNFIAPALWGKIERPHSNDGDGLDAEDSLKLARILKDSLETKQAKAYVKIRDAELAALPPEDCTICNATGTRNDEYVQGKCNACNGKGQKDAWDKNYILDEDNIRNFATFVEHSGGFEIW